MVLTWTFLPDAKAQQECKIAGTACDSADPCTDESDCDGDGVPDGRDCCDTLNPACCDPETETCAPEEIVCCPCEGPASLQWDGAGLRPLTDLGFTYEGQSLGLFVSKDPQTQQYVYSNSIPTNHRTAGLAEGAKIIPRNTAGSADYTNGYIGVLSIGFSNVKQEFGDLIQDKIEPLTAPNLDGLNGRLVFVNGAIELQTLCEWSVSHDPLDMTNPWEIVLGEGLGHDGLLDNGRHVGSGTTHIVVDKNQIQVVWMKNVIGHPLGYYAEDSEVCGAGVPCSAADSVCGAAAGEFSDWRTAEVDLLKTVLQHIREYFPNVRQVYLSGRTYGGYANECGATIPNPADVPFPCGLGSMEPYAYWSNFSIQMLMQLQIADGLLAYSGLCQDPSSCYNWIAWGPYIWSNGTYSWSGGTWGNSTILPYETEKLYWHCDNACADGTHPSGDDHLSNPDQSGQSKVSGLLYSFFKTDEVTQQWFLSKAVVVSGYALPYPPRDGIDRLQDKKRQGTTVIDDGATTVRVKFDKPVYDQTSGNPVSASSFEVAVTGGTAPTVSSVTAIGSNDDEFDVVLSSMIVPGQWTTIIAKVKDAAGNVIRANPHDRVHLGFLPGDADGNKTVNQADVTHLEDVLANPTLGNLAFHDINRDGSITTADKTRLIQLIQGTDTTQAWNNYTMPAMP